MKKVSLGSEFFYIIRKMEATPFMVYLGYAEEEYKKRIQSRKTKKKKKEVKKDGDNGSSGTVQ